MVDSLDMFAGGGLPVDAADTPKTYSQDTAVTWTAEATSHVPPTAYTVRVAKFQNGRRGIQFVRRCEDGSLAYCSSVVLHPDEYYSLAQCIFKDSGLIKELLLRFPAGADSVVDRIRELTKK